jgi:hypothetical protein
MMSEKQKILKKIKKVKNKLNVLRIKKEANFHKFNKFVELDYYLRTKLEGLEDLLENIKWSERTDAEGIDR